MPNQQTPLNQLFMEVAESWDLQALYDDLGDVKHEPLTDLDKMYLRGLLQYGSRTKLAAELQKNPTLASGLNKNPEQLREYLQANLYPLIGALTGHKQVTSSRIGQWLMEKGYSTSRVSMPSSSSEDASEESSSSMRKVFIGAAGVVLTIATGVAIEVFSGVFTSTLNPQPATITPPGSIEVLENLTEVAPPAGVFNYGGSTTWATVRGKIDPVIQNTHPGFQLRYVDPISGSPGSGAGIRMVLNNQLSFSQSSRPVNDEEYRQAQDRGFQLTAIPVAIDGIAIAVHPSLAIPGLTVDQLRAIYLGEINNWQSLGGPNLPIIPYSRDPEAGGTVTFFVNNVLNGQTFGPTVKIVTNTSLALRELDANLGGIYYASAPEVIPQCTVKALPIGKQAGQLVAPYQEPYVLPAECPARRNQLNAQAFQSGDYPITRRLFVVIKESESGQMDQQAGEAYAKLMLTREGQTLLQDAGFVSIR